MKKFSKINFRKGIAGTLISVLVLFFSLCCSPDSMAKNMPSMPMSSETMNMAQKDGMITQVRLANVHDICHQCECKNVVAVKDDYSRKFNVFSFSFKNNYTKFFATSLLDSLNQDSGFAFNDTSPPKTLHNSIPIYLFDRVFRL